MIGRTISHDQVLEKPGEGDHVPPRWQEVARETLDGLDRPLGPVCSPGRVRA